MSDRERGEIPNPDAPPQRKAENPSVLGTLFKLFGTAVAGAFVGLASYYLLKKLGY